MITLENRFFPVRSSVCFFVEGGIIIVSVLLSYFFLNSSGHFLAIALQDVVWRGVVMAFICQSCMYLLDMYDLKYSQTWGEIFFSLLFSIGFVCVGIGLLTYALPRFGIEGNMYYMTIVFVAVLLLLWRMAFDIYLQRIAPGERVLILGTGVAAKLLGQEIRQRERLGFQLTGFVGIAPEEIGKIEGDMKLLGNFSQLMEIAKTYRVNKVLVALNERRGGYPVQMLLDLKVMGINVVEWTEYFEKLVGWIPIENLAPSYFIFQPGFRKTRLLLYARRVIGILAAVVLIALLSPLMFITAILVKADSNGPVFYMQERVGKRGKVFRIIKFRSMRQDAERSGGAEWAVENDPRVTRVGRWIRRTRIDEIPQLFNVLKGDLDIVGPRPERPEFVKTLTEMIPYYSLRHNISPGLTGWAQVMFMYCGTIEESKEKLQYDLFYIKNMSIKLDLLILFRTIKIVLLGRGAR